MLPPTITLIQNCALLFMAVVSLNLLEFKQLRMRPMLNKYFVTFLLSCLGVVVMAFPYELAPGILLDSRNILLFVVGLYFGGPSTLVVVVVTASYRLMTGGDGVLPGIITIIYSALAGRMMFMLYRDRLGKIPFSSLLLGSLTLHLLNGYLFYVTTVAIGLELRQILIILTLMVTTFTLITAFLALFMSRRIHSAENGKLLVDMGDKRRLLSSAIEQIPSVVVITNTLGVIEYVNSRFTDLTGYSDQEAIGQHTRILNSGLMPQSVFTELWETITSGDSWHGELLNKRKDGSLFWESVSIAPFHSVHGKVEKYIAVKEDITERKELEARINDKHRKLEELDQVKSKFISMMSHELMTPLNHILGPTEIVLESADDPDTVELLKMVQLGGSRLKRIFQDMIFISDKSFSKEEFREESVKLDEFLETFRSRDLNGSHGTPDQMIIRVDEALPGEVVIRTELVTCVIDHLVENAYKFSDNGTVELLAAWQEGYVSFHVKDRGPGVPEALKQRIGKPFEQLDTSRTRKTGGMGLGLAVCRVIAEICGGRFEVVNRPNGGSDFSFYYPIESVSAVDFEVRQSLPAGSISETATGSISRPTDDAWSIRGKVAATKKRSSQQMPPATSFTAKTSGSS